MPDETPATPATQTLPAPVLRDVVMHAHKPNDPGTAVVTKSELCTRSQKAAGVVRHIEFDVTGSGLEGVCASGQSVGVIAPGTDEKGRPHAPRLYSLACPTGGEDGAGKILSTTVKRTIDEHWTDHRLFTGVCSNYLCDACEGDEIRVTGPAGKRFVLPKEAGAHGYVFVATGTGIAPFRGFCMELLKDHPQTPITLVMGAPYETDLLYDEYFRAMDKSHANFRYLTAISRHSGANGETPMYVDGRFDGADAALTEQLRDEKTLVYVCGIAGMEIGLFRRMVFDLGDDVSERYVRVDDEIRDPGVRWERKMMHKKIKTTKRVFLEVYA